jgi:hypothetical protein
MKQTSNVERSTPNAQVSSARSKWDVGRWTLGVGRLLLAM